MASLVNDIIMPPIGLLLGRVDFSNLFINLSGPSYATLAEAKRAGAATLNYGLFLNTVIEFLIVGFAIFLVVRQVNRLRPPAPVAAPVTRECPYCAMAIAVAARRCPHCTSELTPWQEVGSDSNAYGRGQAQGERGGAEGEI